MTTFPRDLRYALRSLLRTRGFAATAVLTLTLGMTLCTTAMVVMKGYLLQNLPYPGAERLYSVRYSKPGEDSPREMQKLDWSSLNDVIEHPIAWDLDVFYLLGGEHAESISGAWVTPGFVQGLGVRPARGRGFDKESFAPGSINVALISHRLWNTRFGADPHIVGRMFTAYVSDRPDEAESFTIIGVMPAGFWHINGYTDIFTPLRAPTYPYMVRLNAGVTPEKAAARITAVVSAGARNVPKNWTADLFPSHALYVQSVRPLLQSVSAAAGLVLFVACANVAGLLLIRATTRQKEIAVRAALGAGRAAIARMLLAEALILGTAASVLALFLTRLTLGWLAPLIQQQIGRPAPGGALAFAIDAKTLTFAVAMGMVTAVVCTMAPLATALRPGLQGALQIASRTATEGRGGRRMRATLIALEIAASLALLAGSSLMVRSVMRMLRTDLGFSAENVINASITLRQNRYPDPATRVEVFERMVSRLAEVPGAESIGLTTAWPVQQPRLQSIETAAPSGTVSTRAAIQAVTGTYFAALNIPIAAGRTFTAADRLGAEPVALVSETLARRLWPVGRAVGNRVIVPQEQERGEPVPVQRLVVGTVRDVRQGPADDDLADVYVPMLQAGGRFAFVLMRTAGDPARSLAPFRSAFRDIDPEISVHRAGPLQARVDDLVAGPRFLASLLAAFATIAALLALIGVYGVIAYAIRQREREIAVRMALGADPARLTRFFVRQGSMILIAGIGLGVLAALGVGRVIEGQLFGVSSRDPIALVAAVGAFAMAGLLAIWWPSRRAAATNPAIALRAE